MAPSNTLQISVNGDLWWGGFTAEITVRNASDQPLDSWSTSFISAHDLDPEAWGVEINRELLGEGLSLYTLTGTSWGQSIPAGGELRVGFNGSQSVDLGRNGALTEAMLMAERSMGESVMADGGAHTAEHTAEHPAEHAAMSHGHNTMTGPYTDITTWGSFHGSNHNSEHNELVGGRTAITTEAMEAYNGLRAFAGLESVALEDVGAWAYAQGLTNNAQAWGDDTKGVGLWYAMQAAKVGWISDETYNPQILADIQRTARQGETDAVMAMVETFGHEGFASYLRSNALVDTFTNTLKMEPHYGGWMHGRTHGFLSIEGVAINHDINHLTVLGWDQQQPFMNDTFDYPQWPALEVSDDTVINYFQSIVTLGDPLSSQLETLGAPSGIGPNETPPLASTPSPSPETESTNNDPITGESLAVEISGDLWWGGLTASLAVTNTGDQKTDNWGLNFISAHQFTGDSWGTTIETETLADGLYRYQLTGADWGQSIDAGETIRVGFNARSADSGESEGALTTEILLALNSELVVV
ncbi:carbohydrate-binding module family 2-containing protein [Synechococcus sp. PROS-7-1]|uniref:cellulose binding domain-containing protein n=1 Tax=Synechococcus sp. PROS-7-1 TaxID=1442556 RepID=UPI001646898C|nr:cellulose binding domain-containing protein [Synechococcus sp. PROS-7-1]QNI86404.1 carbohydrate-binding module family 2-containing protein [Synechococcus sp. PROS-7-1]